MDGWSPSVYGGDNGDDEYDRRSERPGSSHHNYDGRGYHHQSSDVVDSKRGGGGGGSAYPERVLKEELGVERSDDEVSYEDGNLEDREWAESMLQRGLRVVRVTYPRTANNEKELTVVRGEFLELLDDSRKWWRARNNRGAVGHVPHTIVAPFDPASNGERRGPSSRKGQEFRYF